ncbi:two-component system, OmpR family, sensor histidine kinase AdeS [Kosakonia oryzendophytica]|uniref:histidine kinase n=1 Tax=Kosakonia oryzendophytica TaxID=1005665 RepID=A0A1C4CWP2_9ENTR|nr:ATP-binding protein [Kosakonia oryzendophytica]SCC23463.1 two-component system, OmpR family, sensor histidine kinase AdeS [Kosakonia oryzendophytica]
MNKDQALSRQILLFMISLTLIVIAITIMGSYFFYAFIIDYIPGGTLVGDEDSVTYIDWIWLFVASASSLIVSFFFTIRLSAKILNPLSSVATSLRRIAQGDLGARAFCAYSHLGELNNLVNDFNEMAEKLQALDSQRKSWNAAIAHEFRTPVTVLRGRLQGLVDGVFEPSPTLFNNLLKQTEGLTNLIDDLRIVGSSGTTDFSLKLTDVELQDTIQNAIDAFSLEFTRNEFQIITQLQAHHVVCDPLRIIQCLTVLFDNAIKYATPKIIVIRNGVTEGSSYIQIEDYGPGIPEDFHRFLFQPFQRGSRARNVNPKGCGLGLSVVKAIMNAHGGDVSYTLLNNHHSVFTLSWPASKTG